MLPSEPARRVISNILNLTSWVLKYSRPTLYFIHVLSFKFAIRWNRYRSFIFCICTIFSAFVLFSVTFWSVEIITYLTFQMNKRSPGVCILKLIKKLIWSINLLDGIHCLKCISHNVSGVESTPVFRWGFVVRTAVFIYLFVYSSLTMTKILWITSPELGSSWSSG